MAERPPIGYRSRSPVACKLLTAFIDDLEALVVRFCEDRVLPALPLIILDGDGQHDLFRDIAATMRRAAGDVAGAATPGESLLPPPAQVGWN